MKNIRVPADRLRIFIPIVVILFFLLFIWIDPLRLKILEGLFPEITDYEYPRISLRTLLGQHAALVAVSSSGAVVAGLLTGIGVTRPGGRAFLQLAQDITSLAQTFPPVAVLALVIPALGFGFKPAVFALFAYSVLPVVKNCIAGLESVSRDMIDVARGMGMTRLQILLRVELPLAMRIILAGIRTSVIINVGTATVGSVIGAGGLGVLIIAGLVRDNGAFIFTGAATSAFLALSLDWLFSLLDRRLYSGRSHTEA